MSLEEFPLEVLASVVGQCDVAGILNCRRVCRKLNDAVEYSKALRIVLEIQGMGEYKAVYEDLKFEDVPWDQELSERMAVAATEEERQDVLWEARNEYYSNSWPELTDDAIMGCRENGLGYLLRNVERIELAFQLADSQSIVTLMALLGYLGELEPRSVRFEELLFTQLVGYLDCYSVLLQLDRLSLRFSIDVSIMFPPFVNDFLNPAPVGRNVKRLDLYLISGMMARDGQTAGPLRDHIRLVSDFGHGELQVDGQGLVFPVEDLTGLLHGCKALGKLTLKGLTIQGPHMQSEGAILPQVRWLDIDGGHIDAADSGPWICPAQRLSLVLYNPPSMTTLYHVQFPQTTHLTIHITPEFGDTDFRLDQVFTACPNVEHLTIIASGPSNTSHNFTKVSPSILSDTKISSFKLISPSVPPLKPFAAALSHIPKLTSLKINSQGSVGDTPVTKTTANEVAETLINSLNLNHLELRSLLGETVTIPGTLMPNSHDPRTKMYSPRFIVNLDAYKSLSTTT